MTKLKEEEKAIYLIEKFSKVGLQQRDEGIACARIFAEEAMKFCPYIDKKNCETIEQFRSDDELFVYFWENVIKFIDKYE